MTLLMNGMIDAIEEGEFDSKEIMILQIRTLSLLLDLYQMPHSPTKVEFISALEELTFEIELMFGDALSEINAKIEEVNKNLLSQK